MRPGLAEASLGAQRGYPDLSVIPDDELDEIKAWMVRAVVLDGFLTQLDRLAEQGVTAAAMVAAHG